MEEEEHMKEKNWGLRRRHDENTCIFSRCLVALSYPLPYSAAFQCTAHNRPPNITRNCSMLVRLNMKRLPEPDPKNTAT